MATAMPYILLTMYVLCITHINAARSSRQQLPIRPVLRANSDVPPSLPLFEEPPGEYEMPRGKDLNEVKLRRKLGDDLNEMWSSASEPGGDNVGAQMELDLPSITWLEEEIGDLNRTFGRSNPEVVTIMSDWLTSRVSCPVVHEWIDIGQLFWPRYIRHGRCVKKVCSWPAGMECFPSDFMTIHLLRWHCRKNKGKKASQESNSRRCRWLNVPYSVMVGCSCKCPRLD